MTDPTMPKDPSTAVTHSIWANTGNIYDTIRNALIREQSKPQQIEYEPFDLERALSGESVFNRDGEERKVTSHKFDNRSFVVHFPDGFAINHNKEILRSNYRMRRKTTTKYYAFVLWGDGQYTASGTYDSIEELHKLVTQHKGTIIAEHSIEVPA